MHGIVFMKAAEDAQALSSLIWSATFTVIGHLTIIPPCWFTYMMRGEFTTLQYLLKKKKEKRVGVEGWSWVRSLVPVVRLNIRGRSHRTWLRCPIHPSDSGAAGQQQRVRAVCFLWFFFFFLVLFYLFIYFSPGSPKHKYVHVQCLLFNNTALAVLNASHQKVSCQIFLPCEGFP